MFNEESVEPKISIITPVYDNGKEYVGLQWLKVLNECLKNQLEQDFEWVIVYDGISNDCRKTVKNFKNVKYHELGERKGNWGNFARDFGLKQATGKYIVFIDQDNILFENYLSVLGNVLDFDPKIGFSVCPIYISWKALPKILFPTIERGNINTLCFMVRKEIISILGWWATSGGNGDEFFVLKNLVDNGINGLCMPNLGPLGIWNGIRYKYPKEIYPRFIDYSIIEKIAGKSDKDTRKDENLWFSL